MEIYEKRNADSLVPPRKTNLIELLCKTDPNHPIAQRYQEEEKKYQENIQKHLQSLPKKEPVELPELKPISTEDFYKVFKGAFSFFNGRNFEENANNGESQILAKTLCFYFLNKKKFLQSPLLNRKSVPSLEKGLMIVGSYGTGKTVIMKTFFEMMRYAASNPIGVLDVDGTNQFLARYKIGFGYETANDVVKSYESLSSPEEKELFWRKMSRGMKYFDDIMTENTASNYGKIEVFKDIFEMRYVTGAKTMISLNYAGESIDETLDSIATKYGERVYDRLFEMFNIVELKGKSLRK